MFILTTVEDR